MRKTPVVTTYFRERRMRDFCRLLQVHSGLQILDVGGNPAIWNLVPESIRPQVIFVNMPRAAEPRGDPWFLPMVCNCPSAINRSTSFLAIL